MAQPEHDPSVDAEFSVKAFVCGATTICVTAWPNACFNRGPVEVEMKCPGWGTYEISAKLVPIPFNARARVSRSPSASKSSPPAQACSAPARCPDQRDDTTEAFETFPPGKTQFPEGSAWCSDGRAVVRQGSQTPSTIPDSFCSQVPQQRRRPGCQSADPLTSECGPARKSPRVSKSEDGKCADQHTSERRPARKSSRVSQGQKTARAMHEKSP